MKRFIQALALATTLAIFGSTWTSLVPMSQKQQQVAAVTSFAFIVTMLWLENSKAGKDKDKGKPKGKKGSTSKPRSRRGRRRKR